MKLSIFFLTFFLLTTSTKARLFGRNRGANKGGRGGRGGNGGRNGDQNRGDENGSLTNNNNNIFSSPAGTITIEEENEIEFMREEEKLARDVYLTLYDEYGSRVFRNIASSEQTHMNRMKDLIEYYDLDDPVESDNIGSFTNVALAGLYTDLVDEGLGSLQAAFLVGARIEEIDIKDLRDGMEGTDVDTIDNVYNRLLNASYNHLRAFVRNYEATGATYMAQTEASGLTQDEVNEILGRST